MQVVNPNRLVNFDQCSASSEKYRCLEGRGRGRIEITEWIIGGIAYSAMAALTPLGFLPCTHIIEETFSHIEVTKYLHHIQKI